jgi:hypothetical protein
MLFAGLLIFLILMHSFSFAFAMVFKLMFFLIHLVGDLLMIYLIKVSLRLLLEQVPAQFLEPFNAPHGELLRLYSYQRPLGHLNVTLIHDTGLFGRLVKRSEKRLNVSFQGLFVDENHRLLILFLSLIAFLLFCFF